MRLGSWEREFRHLRLWGSAVITLTQRNAEIRRIKGLSTEEISGALTDYERRSIHANIGRYLQDPQQRCLMTMSQLTVFRLKKDGQVLNKITLTRLKDRLSDKSRLKKPSTERKAKFGAEGHADRWEEKFKAIHFTLDYLVQSSQIDLGKLMQWDKEEFKKILQSCESHRPYLENEEPCDAMISKQMRKISRQRLRTLGNKKFDENRWPKPEPFGKKQLEVLQSFFTWRERARQIIHYRAVLFNRVLEEKLKSAGKTAVERRAFLRLKPYRDTIGETFWFNGKDDEPFNLHLLNHPNYCFLTESLKS